MPVKALARTLLCGWVLWATGGATGIPAVLAGYDTRTECVLKSPQHGSYDKGKTVTVFICLPAGVQP